MPSTSITVPEGSNVQVLEQFFTESSFGSAGLSGLTNNASTPTINYSAPSGSSLGKVVIFLGAISLGSSGTIALDNGTDLYELTVAAGAGARRIEFNEIPNAFLSAFSIKNSTGVTLASTGNSVSILPL